MGLLEPLSSGASSYLFIKNYRNRIRNASPYAETRCPNLEKNVEVLIRNSDKIKCWMPSENIKLADGVIEDCK